MMSNGQSYEMDVLSSKNMDDDLFKENISPYSKKMKLFELLENRFLSTGSISMHILNDEINEIKPFISLQEDHDETIEITKNQTSVVFEKNNSYDELSLGSRTNVNDNEVKTTSEITQSEVEKENKVQKIETKKEREMTKSDNESDCKDFESILDENMKVQDDVTSDVESEQNEKEEQLNFEEKEIEKELDGKKINNKEKDIDNDEQLDMEEREFNEDKKLKRGGGEEEEEEEDDDDDDEDRDKTDTDSEEESETPMSFLEKRRLNKMKLMGQMSNLLDSARLKMKQIAQKFEKPKIELNSNPRKRKRSILIDPSTRDLIKEMTPVRRSSRQVERKYYTEGVSDPELIKLLSKLENYARLNGQFKSPQDELCYDEDFLGFKQDASRRALYPEDYNPRRRRYRRVVHRSGRSVPVPAMDPSEITDDVLSQVVTHVSAKVYSQAGSTCHQCRQKTLDIKTFCRSGECTGVRGQFCGVCLLNRYGEDIVKALLDEKWACPPCRDICNCSICRNRKGLPPTGIMTPLALGKGFDSVKDYLKEAEKDLEFEEY